MSDIVELMAAIQKEFPALDEYDMGRCGNTQECTVSLLGLREVSKKAGRDVVVRLVEILERHGAAYGRSEDMMVVYADRGRLAPWSPNLRTMAKAKGIK